MRFICRSMLALLSVMILLGSAHAASVITMGETAVLSIKDGGNGNLLIAQKAALAQTATVQSLSFYVTTASGNLILGIYDATGPNGGPGALKASTRSFTPVTGWNTALVVTPVSLAVGNYWLAYLPSSYGLGFVRTTGSCYWYSYTFNSLPSKFSASAAGCPGAWSFYATLTLSTTGEGSCGSSNGADLTSAPTANLCKASTASSVSGSGPWTWTCAGSSGGTTAACSALLDTKGVCGSANGVAASTAPTANLCSAGKASTVTGSGPWSWSCAGSNGGTTATCSASLKTASSGSTGSTALFPAMGSQTRSVYPWAQYPPGVTYNGGIPARTTQCGPTLTPVGGDASDLTQIQNAINNCPAGQHVQLGNGVFVLNADQNLNIGYNGGGTQNNITVRGVGPGPGGAIPDNQSSVPDVSVCGATPCTIIYKKNWATASNNIFAINYGTATLTSWLGKSINLASDGAQGATSVTLASAPPATAGWAAGRLALLDVLTANCETGTNIWPNATSPELFSNAFGPVGSAPWFYFGRECRSLMQVVKIGGISGKVVTLDAPLSMDFTVASSAQLTPWCDTCTVTHGIGIEQMYLYGGGNGAGNVSIDVCDGCWVKHIESHWANGPQVNFSSCYHCELRDSYIHELSEYTSTTSGGGGYLLSVDQGTANSLVENNIIWNGDKVIVMRSSGGGNVVAYNYMDDAFDSADPVAQEAGANAGHFLGSHMELIEGNWSHKYSGDSWWGNALYITAFRNQFSGLRSANSWLATFVNRNGYPYCDCTDRAAVTLQNYQWYHNIVGNILGFKGQVSTMYNGDVKGTKYVAHQTSMRYESNTEVDDYTADSNITMYELGATQANAYFPADPTMYLKTNRQGNYDFVTNSQIWYSSNGGHGTTSTGSPLTLPNSLYLASKPAFFPSVDQWPWVVPSTGTTYTLPAKARYDAGKPNTLP